MMNVVILWKKQKQDKRDLAFLRVAAGQFYLVRKDGCVAYVGWEKIKPHIGHSGYVRTAEENSVRNCD